jgi:hypothetical protein
MPAGKSEAASALVHRTLLGATALAKINDWLSLCFAYSDTGKIGAEMISDPGARKEEICPVSDDLLGALYRSDKQGIAELVATVAPNVRVLLALFCYPRSHLHTMGLAIAATCEEDDLVRCGGRVGAVLYARSREAPQLGSVPSHAAERRRITLATGPLRKMIPLDDELDEASPSGAAEETKVAVAVLDDFNNAANSTGGAADTALAASEAVEAAAVNLRQRIKNFFIGSRELRSY